jgi:hypothetical protein
MAWTAPSTFVAGAILTAASLNTNVRDNTLAGGPIYTTETLRDAAITSPFEGQRAYITGSTETTAAGSTTYIPTGIQTFYNGTVWVTVTPVGTSQSATGVTALTSGSSVLTGSPGTVPTVTLRTGTTVLVSSSVWTVPSTTNAVYVSIGSAATAASGVLGGTGTFQYGASPAQCSISGGGIITGLTAGLNTFYQQYSVSSGSASIYSRHFTVQGIA